MEIVGWILVVLLFVVGMAGAIFPILPGALAIFAGFIVYGLFISFDPFNIWFWLLQVLIVVALFIADYAVSAWGVKRYGGSRASVIGSTIGIIIGPFVIPGIGLLLGPLLGAVIGELLVGANSNQAFKAGFGAVVGLLTSTVVKIILQLAMIVLFVIWLL